MQNYILKIHSSSGKIWNFSGNSLSEESCLDVENLLFHIRTQGKKNIFKFPKELTPKEKLTSVILSLELARKQLSCMVFAILNSELLATLCSAAHNC